MDIQEAIQYLDYEWGKLEGDGFFALLERGQFDQEGYERLLQLLDSIEVPDEPYLDRRFVEVVWFIPTFMRWQRDSWPVDAEDTKLLDAAIGIAEGRVRNILGSP